MPIADPRNIGRMVQSEANIVGAERMVAIVHDTGNIGMGYAMKNGRVSATLYTVKDVREHCLEVLKLCDLLDGEVTMDDLREAASEEE